MEYSDSFILRHALIGPDTDNARALPLTPNLLDPIAMQLDFHEVSSCFIVKVTATTCRE